MLADRYVAYGSRTPTRKAPNLREPGQGGLSRLSLDKWIRYRVAHSYFWHFYAFSAASSLFWGAQILNQGRFMKAVGSKFAEQNTGTMSMDQVLLVWTLMAIQGCRRLYEEIYVFRPSLATMPLSVYLIGIGFYLLTGMAVWIEGSCKWLALRTPCNSIAY